MAARRLPITKRNSAFQILESLISNRHKRHQTRSFVVEGVQPISMAVDRGWKFEAVVYAGGRRLSHWAADVIARADPPICYELSHDLLEQLSGKTDTSELLAVLRMPGGRIERFPIRDDLLVAVYDRPSNQGNLGTLIRSCDSFGVHALALTGRSVDPYDPATITASRGSLFALPLLQLDSPAALASAVAEARNALHRLQVIGTDEKAALDLEQVDLTGPTLLLFGNEARGMSRACRDLCDVAVRIPMVGSATSLNVSVAASIALYEAGRQRRARVGSPLSGL
jgi:tRNA G18 (ribose-2'-O)-methylase SpoU